MRTDNIPKVFISYSWDDDDHRSWVRAFATRLRTEGGLDVSLDQWNAVPGDQLGGFMANAVRESDFVLVVCTPNYKAKSDRRTGGVGYEGDIMTGEIITEGNDRKFIPLLRRGDWQSAAPSWVAGKYYISLTGDPYSEESYLDLLKTLHGKRAPAPSIGTPPQFDPEQPCTDSTKNERSAAPPSEAEGILEAPGTPPERQYSNLFTIAAIELPYIVLIGGWDANVNEYRRGDVTCRQDFGSSFTLPDEFRDNPFPDNINFTESKCRLARHDCTITPANSPNRLMFEFTEISYADYCRSGEYLDDPLPNDPARTFRDKYARRVQLHDFSASPLTNICGVGLFLITTDNMIVVSKHSPAVRVYGGIWSFSASGTMDWKENVHPFDEVARECDEEVAHRVNPDNLRLFGFGIDTKKLYYQFSFFERIGLTSRDVLQRARLARDFHAEMERLEAIPFEVDMIVELINSRTWEPAAAAGLLTLCTKRFGIEAVEDAIRPDYVRDRARSEMLSEWAERASRQGVHAVMSSRYPYDRCEDESRKYIDAVMHFMESDLKGRDVLEIGGGIGRLTARMVHRARRLTCVEASPQMLACNRKRLGNFVNKVEFHNIFGQEYVPTRKHDVVVCSLVLIHNIVDEEFSRLTEVMAECADTVFLFEHIDVAMQVSAHTRPRTEDELCRAFKGYEVAKRRDYKLFNDQIVFLKLVRK